jgi:hypothetical protein
MMLEVRAFVKARRTGNKAKARHHAKKIDESRGYETEAFDERELFSAKAKHFKIYVR